MKEYDHKKIEKKWQTVWEKKGVYKTLNNSKKKKYYVLDMFPYPSGVGLHVGHPKGYIGSDIFARLKRMQGLNVLHPMGYDAFGLPAEQYAIEHNINPKQAVEKNVKTFEKQLSIIGLSYDWGRRVNTTDPGFYHWTQWIFLKIYDSWYNKNTNKAEPIDKLIKIFEKSGNIKINAVSGDVNKFSASEWKRKTKKEKQDILMKYRLAYEGYSEVNWCPKLGTVLTGRNITFEIFPLDYDEFKLFGGKSIDQYMHFGGFPEIVLEENEEKKIRLLTQYFNDILLRDILEKYEIAPTQQFKAVTQYIIANTGLKISANKLAKELGINSRTAENYLSYMIDAYLVFEVPFFSYSTKTKYMAGRASKYYCIDNGLTNALSAKVNKGHLFEAIVAQMLRRKDQELYYWSGKKEVDFIQKQKAYQVSITTIDEEAFTELKQQFKHIKETQTITPKDF